MAYPSLHERVMAYGAVPQADGGEGRMNKRSVAAIAVGIVALTLLVAVVMSGGGGRVLQNRDMLSQIGSAELAKPSKMALKLHALMTQLEGLANETEAAIANVEGNATQAPEGNATQAPAGDSDAAGNVTEPVTAPVTAPAEEAVVEKDCGDPMATYNSFSCWLGKYRDPEDVEDWLQQHKDHLYNTEEWYKDKKNFGMDTEKWYELHKGFGNFSRAKWLGDHYLHDEGTGVAPKEVVTRSARVQILASVLKSMLQGNGTETKPEGDHVIFGSGAGHCGLDCWLAKYADPENIEGPGGWYETHKHIDGGLSTEEWYAQQKNFSGGLSAEEWYAKQPTFDFEAWFKANYNINDFNWPDWLEAHGLRRTEMVRDFRTAILVSSILDAANTNVSDDSNEDIIHGKGKCGLDCWLAKFPDPENIEGPGGWYATHKHIDGGLSTEEWYAQQKNLSGGLDSTESWYAKQPTFDFEGWYRSHANINNFSWPDWYRQNGMRPSEFSKELHQALKVDAAHLLELGQQRKAVLKQQELQLDSWLQAQAEFNLTAWLAAQPKEDVSAWLRSVRQNNTLQAYLDAHPSADISAWLGQFKPFNLSAWLDAQDDFSLDEWLQRVENASSGLGSKDLSAWLDSQRGFDVSLWLQAHPTFDLAEWMAQSTQGLPTLDAWMAQHPGGESTEQFLAEDSGRNPPLDAWLQAHRAFDLKQWMAAAAHTPAGKFDMHAWLQAHSGPGTLEWLASNETKTVDTSTWLDSHRALNLHDWMAEVANTTVGKFDLASWLKEHKAFNLHQWFAQEANTTIGRFDLHQWLKDHEEFNLHHWLAQEANTTVGRFQLSQWLDAHKNYNLHQFLSENPTFNLSGWLEQSPDVTWHDTENKTKAFKLSQWLDEHKALNLHQWLALEANTTIGRFNLHEWLNTHKAFNLHQWLEQQKNTSLGRFDLSSWLKGNPGSDRWVDGDNATTAFHLNAWMQAHKSSLSLDDYLAANKMNFSLSAWLDERKANTDTEAYLIREWQAAQAIEGANWSVVAPGPEWTAPNARGPGFCCCGFACLKAKNECCGPYLEEGYQRTNWDPEYSDRKPVAAVLAEAKAGRAAPMVQLAMTRLAVAAGKEAPSEVAWTCIAGVSSAPVRVGKMSCDIECLSLDGINCVEPPEGGCGAAADNATALEAAGKAQGQKVVVCGAALVKTWGTDGYSEPTHWCAKGKKALQKEMGACASGGPGRGSTFGSGLTFDAGVTFSGGDTFGDKNVFGEGDAFGPHTAFGSLNQFGAHARFGAFASFNSSNRFGQKAEFGAGAVFRGNDNLIRKQAVIGAGADFVGEHNKLSEEVQIGAGTNLGSGTTVGEKARLGRGVRLGEGSSVGQGAKFGVDVEAHSAPAFGAAGEHEGLTNGTTFYRPDPGSDFSREGDPRISFKPDGYNHWPEYYDDDKPGGTGGGGNAQKEDNVSVEAVAKAPAGEVQPAHVR